MTSSTCSLDWQHLDSSPEGVVVIVSDGKNVAVSRRNPHGVWWKLLGEEPYFDGVKLHQLAFKPTRWMPMPEPSQL